MIELGRQISTVKEEIFPQWQGALIKKRIINSALALACLATTTTSVLLFKNAGEYQQSIRNLESSEGKNNLDLSEIITWRRSKRDAHLLSSGLYVGILGIIGAYYFGVKGEQKAKLKESYQDLASNTRDLDHEDSFRLELETILDWPLDSNEHPHLTLYQKEHSEIARN